METWTWCAVPECDRYATKGGYCQGHWKRKMRRQRVNVPLTYRPTSTMERLCEAALAYTEAEDDKEWERARDNLRKAAAAYRGLPPSGGRPPKVSPAAVAEAVAEAGVCEAAAALGIHRTSVWRVLQRMLRNGYATSPKE